MSERRDLPEIRIQNVAVHVHADLMNIADNYGVSLQDLLKPKLREIANSYPEQMRQPVKKD